MQLTMLIHENRPTDYLVNQDHKLIIRTTGTVKDKDRDIQVYNTNYLEIKVIMDSEGPNIKTVKTKINMDLELRMSEENLMYRMEQLLSTWTDCFCAL